MKNKFTEVDQILYYFFSNITNHNGIINKSDGSFRTKEDPLYKLNEEALNARVKNGWKLNDIALKLMDAKTLKVKTSYLKDIVPERPPIEKEDVNLIGVGHHYHPELFNIDRSIFDYETGNLIKPGAVNIKDKFTLGDLVEYYFLQLNPSKVDRSTVVNILRYYLNNSTRVDEILTGIDLWTYQDNDKNIGNDPWKLKEYIAQAFEESETLKGFINVSD